MFQIQAHQKQAPNGHTEKPVTTEQVSPSAEQLDTLQLEKTLAEIKVLKQYLKNKQSEKDAKIKREVHDEEHGERIN